jgi:NADH-quinone oxidoreductase subunit M
MVGSITMLIGFIALYAGAGTFDFLELAQHAQAGHLMPSVVANLHPGFFSIAHLPLIIFIGIFLGFAVKVPLVPFHTWLPSAYAEAPTGATILLTGAMSKMGLYGFLRVLLPIFGKEMQQVLTPLLWLAVASVVLSAFAALAQKNLKRIFAYSSINHLGYCLLAIFAADKLNGSDLNLLTQKSAALSGVLLQMFNHGLTAATIFWFIAMIESRSSGARGIDDFGGIRKVAPVMTGLMGIALFSSLGLPGLNGFIGEFLIFKGAFPLVPWASSLCLIALLITVIFILGVIQKVFSGPLNPKWTAFPDLTAHEQIALVPVIALMFCVGLYPQLLLGVINNSVVELVRKISF